MKYTKYIKILTLSLFILTGCRDYNQFEGDKYAPVSDETDGSGGSYTWENPTTPKEKFSFRTTWGDTSVADTTKIKHTALFYYKKAGNWEMFHELTSTLDDYNYGKTSTELSPALNTIVNNPDFSSASAVNNFSTPDTLNIFGITFKTDRNMDSTTINRRFRSTATPSYDLYIVEGNATSLPSAIPYLRATYNFSEVFDRYKSLVPSALTFFVTDASPIHPDPYQDEIFKTRLANISTSSTVVAKFRNSRTSPEFTTFTHGSATTTPVDLPASITDIIKNRTAPVFNSITDNKVNITGISTDSSLAHTIPVTTDFGTPSKDYIYTIKNTDLTLIITHSPTLPTKTLIQYKYTIRDYVNKDNIYKQYIPKDIYVNITSDERTIADIFKDSVKGKYVYETRGVTSGSGTTVEKPMNPIGFFDAKGDTFTPYFISPTGEIKETIAATLSSVVSATTAAYDIYTFDIGANTITTGGKTQSITLTNTKLTPSELWENIRSKYKYIYNRDATAQPLGYLNEKRLTSANGNFKIDTSTADTLAFTHTNTAGKFTTITITDFPAGSPMGKLEVDTPSSSISITLKDTTSPIPPIALSDGLLQQGTTTIGTLKDGNKFDDGIEYTLEHSWVTGTTYTYVYTSGTSIRTIVKTGTSYKLYQEFASAMDVTFVDARIILLKAKLAGYFYPQDGKWAENFPSIILASTETGVLGTYKIGSTTYKITDIDTTDWIVTTKDGAIHWIINNMFGPITSSKVDPKKVIAVQRNDAEITAFIEKINLLKLTREGGKDDGTTFVIPPTGGYVHIDHTYTIGRMIDDNTAIIVGNTTPMITENHGLRGKKYGSLDADDKIVTTIAELSDLDALKTKLAGFKYSTGTTWVDFPDSITPVTGITGVIGKYTVNGKTYNIISINTPGWTVEVTDGTGGTKIHTLLEDSGQYGVATGSTIPFGTEIAVMPSSDAVISDYAEELNKTGIVYPFDGTWKSITITKDPADMWTYLWKTSGYAYNYKIIRIEAPVNINSSILVSIDNPPAIQEVHQLDADGIFYVRKEPSDFTLAFKKITDDQRNAFMTKVEGLVLTDKKSGNPFKITTISGYGTYTHDSKTYQIGRFIDADTVYVVALGSDTMEKHGIIDGEYGVLNAAGTALTPVIAVPYTGDPVGSGSATPSDSGQYHDLDLKIRPSDNKLYLASKNESGNLFLRKFNGITWEDVGTVDAKGQSPSLAFHPTSKEPTIAYKNNDKPQEPGIKKYDETTRKWSYLDGIESEAGHGVTLAYKGDTPYVAYWRDWGAEASTGTKGKLYIKKYTSSPWDSVYDMDTKKVDALDLQSSGTDLYVAYISTDNEKRISVKKYSSGKNWDEMTPTDGITGTEDTKSKSLSLALHGTIPYVSYQKGDSVYVKKNTSGTSWEDVGGSIDDKVNIYRFAIDNNGISYVVYKNKDTEFLSLKRYDSSTRKWVYVSKDFVKIPTDHLSMAIDNNGIPYVAYGAKTGGGPVHVKKFKPHTP